MGEDQIKTKNNKNVRFEKRENSRNALHLNKKRENTEGGNYFRHVKALTLRPTFRPSASPTSLSWRA